MTRRSRWTIALPVLALMSHGLALADSPKAGPDLTGYKTVETATTAPIGRAAVAPTGDSDSPAYLGILLDPDSKQGLVVADVDLDSPAAKAGVKPGDVLRKLDGREIKDGEALVEVLRGKFAGEPIDLALLRRDKPVNAIAILVPWSRVMTPPGRARVGLGVQVAAGKEGKA